LKVEVRLFSGLEKYVSGTKFGQPVLVEITDHFNGRALLEKLNIPEKMVFTIMVNGVHKNPDEMLSDGDRVAIFPPVGGG
jgi:molybdopterin converting factor small subunit